MFVLTLGFSRRSVYVPCLSEALGDLLDAHEQAFAHFGGHTQEHLYDRPRTVCAPSGTHGVRWNTTFKAFADFWGFEYLKRNFLAGRRFRDDLDFHEQLQEWTATVADVRVHGTTHERPVDRFSRERDALVPAPTGRAFRLEAPLTRVVATDYLGERRYEPLLNAVHADRAAGGGSPARRTAGDAAPRPGGRHPSGARGPAPAPDPAGARAGSDCAQRTAALLDRRGFDRRGSARRRGPGPGGENLVLLGPPSRVS